MRHMVVAVEATNESESAAALQGPTRGIEHLSMVCVGMVASASFLDLCDPPSHVPALRRLSCVRSAAATTGDASRAINTPTHALATAVSIIP